jgi:hypothetical protein
MNKKAIEEQTMSVPKIAISTELMKNFKQTLFMSPDNKFEALQTNTGHSLLFSIGSDNIFYVTVEFVGCSTDWEKWVISSTQIAKS